MNHVLETHFVKIMKKKHQNFKVEETGFYVHVENPYIGEVQMAWLSMIAMVLGYWRLNAHGLTEIWLWANIEQQWTGPVYI